MSSEDIRVMQWHVAMDGPWSTEALSQYQAGGYTGLVLIPSRDWIPEDLGFLADMPGLRMFEFSGRVRKDLDAFRVATMRDLTLVTGSRLAVPDVVQPEMRRLCLTDRPGLEVGSRWPDLRAIRIGTWKGTDLQILAGAGNLESAYLEARRQQGTLDGLEGAPAIRSLLAVDYSVRTTEPLKGLGHLTDVRLLAAHPTPPHGRIDVSDLAGSPLETLWLSNADSLGHVDALGEMPSLREIRLIGCRLPADEHRALRRLPKRVDVQLVDD